LSERGIFRTTVGWVRSPRALGFDHSLGRDAGEAPEPPRIARD
jgi:hypothetical protein